MKFNTLIPKSLKSYFDKEIAGYQEAYKQGNLTDAWQHLERAHILGQAYPWQHTYVHYKMLFFGIHIKSKREVVGQIPRLLVGGIKSFVGKVPVGNTGGANVSPLQPMPIPKELKKIIDENK